MAKALTTAYYQQNIARKYFLGCSRGQALMEAQRYPGHGLCQMSAIKGLQRARTCGDAEFFSQKERSNAWFKDLDRYTSQYDQKTHLGFPYLKNKFFNADEFREGTGKTISLFLADIDK